MKTRLQAAVAVCAFALVFSGTLFAQVTVEAEIAESVVDRTPQNPGTAFPADIGQVSAWSLVTGAEGTTIQHVWIHGDLEFPVSLDIDGSPWRTWSTKVIPPEWSGAWRVEIRDTDGNVIETLNFTIG